MLKRWDWVMQGFEGIWKDLVSLGKASTRLRAAGRPSHSIFLLMKVFNARRKQIVKTTQNVVKKCKGIL